MCSNLNTFVFFCDANAEIEHVIAGYSYRQIGN